MLHAIIMAGGSGTRFWPQSRQELPKQLLPLAGQRTMIQQTVDRCTDWTVPARTWIVTNQVQAGRTAAQLPELPGSQILVEPAARNTAPCIGLAAFRILHDDPDAIMLVMPADHVIQPQSAFTAAVQQAVQIVEQNPQRLVLFGVTPGFPSTGYGYIERGRPLTGTALPAFEVAAFREKPQREIAEEYLRAGRFYWNCGIFCWKAQTIVDRLAEFEPEIHARLQRVAEAWRNGSATDVLATEFPLMKSISIDYAILERSPNVTVVEAPFAWDDVGSWLAVARLNGQDADGNTVSGQFCGIQTQNCIVRTDDQHLVAALGVSNLIIVHTADATLVADISQSERVKEVLDQLRASGRHNWL